MTKMKVITHKRLQYYEHHYGMVCLTGVLGCRWHRYQQSQEPSSACDIIWYIVVLVTSLFMLFWFYFWLLSENSWNNFNWFFYDSSGSWKNMYGIVFIVTCTTLTYVGIINILALCHNGLGHQIHLHWIHKLIIALILAGCIITAIAVTHWWNTAWYLQREALMITGPFLHLGAVILMTGLSWFVAAYWMSLYKLGARVLYLGTFISIMLFLYAAPVLIESPCITDDADSLVKPLLVGHRGLAALRPENTKFSFETAQSFVITWESDVIVSLDGVPFLMHDSTLKRTTDVQKKWPEQADHAACWFNMSQLGTLDAGSWFLESDPFKSVKSLSDSDKHSCINQTIPTLEWLLTEAKTHLMSVMFDIKNTSLCDGHPYQQRLEEVILTTVIDSGINPEQVWWLVSMNNTHPLAENLTLVLSYHQNEKLPTPEELLQNNIRIVNAEYGAVPWQYIQQYQEMGIDVNIYVVDSSWLYSLYWCMGVHSITTNQAAFLNSLSQPIWVLTPRQFRAMWMTTDFVSVALIILIFIIHHLRKNGLKMEKSVNSERLSLQGSKIRMTHLQRNRNMKEKLLHTVESFPDMDPSSFGISNEELTAVDVGVHAPSSTGHQQITSLGNENSDPIRHSLSSGVYGVSAISGTEVGDSSLRTAQLSDSQLHIVLSGDPDNCTTCSDHFSDISLEATA